MVDGHPMAKISTESPRVATTAPPNTQPDTSEATPTYSGQLERRPFLRLEPQQAGPISDEVAETLPGVRQVLQPEMPGLVRAVVDHSIRFQNAQRREQRRITPDAISLPVLNRRRRAARMWLQAILHGRVDPVTRHSVGHQWLPQLAGTRADGTTPSVIGRKFLEYVRGLLIASVGDRPAANMLPIAKQMHAIESVLAVHLAAFAAATRRQVKAAPAASR